MKIKKYIHLYCESGVVPVSNGMDDFFNIMARLTTEEFIERARKVHGDEYDYSKVKYVNIETEVCIICNKHGEFWQTPQHHLRGHKCPKCRREERKITQEEFIERAKRIHGDKYDYSKVKYEGILKKVCIICPEHGEFWKSPDSHINAGTGCPKCNHNSTPYTTEEFIEKAKEIHGDKYDYSKTVYEKSIKPICIICPEHGEFWQTPNNHLRGQGCPNCIKYNLEDCIEKLLKSICVSFEKQKTFEWLKNKRKLRLDFYLPKYNVAIECQGIQHFNDIPYFGGKNKLEYVKNNDKLKNTLCNKYNIHLLYFKYNDDIKEFETKLKKICGL